MEHIRIDLAAGYWWLFLGIVGLCGVFATLLYKRTTPEVFGWRKWMLVALRATGIACLVLMLFEPLARIVKSEELQPRLAIAVDVSASMKIRDKSGDRSELARKSVEALLGTFGDAADLLVFDETLQTPTDREPDSLRFNGFRTDIAGAIRSMRNRSLQQHYGAIVLVTDGNHNGTEAPLYGAERAGVGVYSIGIGDTVVPPDVRVSSVLVTGVAIVGETVPISVEVGCSNLPAGEIVVDIKENGTLFRSESVLVQPTDMRKLLTVDWTPSSEGIRKVTATVRPLRGEFTDRNNTNGEFVTVRKNKRKVLVLAGTASPDVSFVKQSLDADPNTEIQLYVQKQQGTFYTNAPNANAFADCESVVLVGFPTSSSPQDVIDRVAAAAVRGTSILFIASQGVDYTRLKSLESVLPFKVRTSRANEFLVSPDVQRGATYDPVLKITGAESDQDLWNNLPPVFRTETFVTIQPGATVLSTLRVGNAPLDEPLLMKREFSGARSVAFLGYGLYRWRLLGTAPAAARGAQPIDVLGAFLSNTMRWLHVKEDEQRVRVRSTQKFYASGEKVGFVATVRDQSLSAVEGAEIILRITSSKGTKEVILNEIGGGSYALETGAEAPGDYSYSATVSVRGTVVGTDAGRFSVGEVGVEEGAITRNVSLLTTLAQRTSALAVEASQTSRLVDAIRADPRMRAVAKTTEKEHALYHLPWLIALGIFCFSLEWFIRKRSGLV